MDELDALKAFRANAPVPSDETLANVRAALERTMATGQPGRRRWRFGVARVLAPVSVAIAILVAVALASPLFGLREGQTNAAARQLRSLADVAAQQPAAAPLAEGQFAYTRSDNLQMNTSVNVDSGKPVTTLEAFTREIWIGADGSGRIHQVSQDPGGIRTMDQQFGPGGLTPPLETNGFTEDELNRLAQDPAALAQAITTRASGTKNPVADESFVLVGDLLRESNAPAQLRWALFQVAAGIPGVDLVGNVADPAGRPGVSVAMTHNGVRSELIFDPKSSMLLAERQTLVAPVADLDFPVGTVIGATTYLSSGIVSSTTATP